MASEVVALLALGVWLYLAFGRGAFWRCAERDDAAVAAPSEWPRIAVVIPARDEAEAIGACIESLLRQDCPGPFSITMVDDNSSDGTADIARGAARACGAEDRLTIVSGTPLPRGWTGKLWAVRQGIEVAMAQKPAPQYLLLSDADIVYAAPMLRWLAGFALARGTVLTSLMVKLNCETFVERAIIPAFIFFFQMLYPFGWVNRRDSAMAAAAGGCMLVQAATLCEVGGIETIRNALIDDCALARRLKARGPIWLGLTDRVLSTRRYPQWHDASTMVSRAAYAQLGYSPLLLAATVAGLTLTFLVPPLAAIFGSDYVRLFGVAAWAMMALLISPTLRFYRLWPLWGVALPAIAFTYLVFTVNSALQFMRGRAGYWKGRFQAERAK